MKAVTVVLGAQWGDEGKGKITDFLAENADFVVRFQGGDNAGHSIQFNGKKYALHLIPSGIFKSNTMNVIANGVVFNPRTFLKEVSGLKAQGFDCANLVVSDRAHVIFDAHQWQDAAQELAKGDQAVGTTKKGIGPTYGDKVARIGIRVGDFVSKDFPRLFRQLMTTKNQQLVSLGGQSIDIESALQDYQSIASQIRPFVKDTVVVLNEAYEQKKTILIEGAQGALLDIDFGTYPYVTSSSTSAGGVAIGTGLGPTRIQSIIGVAKAYSTRVGNGAFPTELKNEIGQSIREKGREYGTTTGRPRRIGWLDTVALRYSVRINGFTGISLMLLDVLSGFDELKICTHYTLNGVTLPSVPARIEDWGACEPHYVTVQGWKEDITSVRHFDDLPLAAKQYITIVETLIGAPIVLISVGPSREQTIRRGEF